MASKRISRCAMGMLLPLMLGLVSCIASADNSSAVEISLAYGVKAYNSGNLAEAIARFREAPRIMA